MNEANNSSQEQVEELTVQKLGNSYVLADINGKIGEITYRFVDVDTWIIDHTYVEPAYRGRQLARRLLDLVVEEAREKGRTIIPSCSYALEQFKQDESYADVWNKSSKQYADPYSTDSASTAR